MYEMVTILLATYNGEQYISHQLESIIKQSYTDWHLLIRDDCSTDNTPAIIKQYQKQHPDKIGIIPNKGKNVGSLLNFGALLSAAKDAIYIMFCDQDDEWKSDKIAITYLKMKELEQQYGTNYPLMIFTNFQYVDEQMRVIEAKQDFEINRIKNFGFPHLLAQNPVYGCTTMLNRALADKVGNIPPQADFHDHWIALIASAFGKLYYLNEKTVLYRQHASNVSGSFDNDSFKKRFQRIFLQQKNFKEARNKYTMLLCFKEQYYGALNKGRKRILDNFLCFFKDKNPLCMAKSIGNGIRSQTMLQSLLLYATVLFAKTPEQTK